jgi:hypothetical protein
MMRIVSEGEVKMHCMYIYIYTHTHISAGIPVLHKEYTHIKACIPIAQNGYVEKIFRTGWAEIEREREKDAEIRDAS